MSASWIAYGMGAANASIVSSGFMIAAGLLLDNWKVAALGGFAGWLGALCRHYWQTRKSNGQADER
jgi:hypothetical protein